MRFACTCVADRIAIWLVCATWTGDYIPRDFEKSSVVRQRAEWMRPSDDPILEHLREYGNLTPTAFENLGVCTSGHATNRLGVLRRAGLVERVADTQGLYGLTEEGEVYLDGEFDASGVSPE